MQVNKDSGNSSEASFRAVLANLLLSMSLIVVSCLIYFYPEMAFCDLIYVFVFAVVIVCMTLPVASWSIVAMMEGTPSNIDVEQIRADIEQECGDDIQDIHDLHVWTISASKIAMTCHIKSTKPLKTTKQVTDLLKHKYGIQQTTIQVEGPEDKEHNPHTFDCENDIHQ